MVVHFRYIGRKAEVLGCVGRTLCGRDATGTLPTVILAGNTPSLPDGSRICKVCYDASYGVTDRQRERDSW